MKNKRRIFLLFIVVVIIGIACSVKKSKTPEWLDALLLITNFSKPQYSLVGQSLDSTSGQVLSNVSVKYSLSGTALEYVTDANGNSVESFSTEAGFIDFLVNKNIPIDEDNPLKLTISASADGYLTNSTEIAIQKYEDISFVIPMVNISSPPSGVAVKQVQVGSASGGVISSDISVATDAEAQTGGTAGIAIPAGTVLKDENGNLLEGNLTATVAYFNNQDESSLLSFPGGLSPSIAADKDGKPAEGNFVTGGFTAIEITDASGKKAHNFSGKSTISMDVPAGTKNPETGKVVAVGDNFPIWSLNSKTGKWTFEGNGVVSQNGDNFKATIQTNHLSFYNLDWHYGPKCQTKKINLAGNYRKVNRISLKLKGIDYPSFIRHKSIRTNKNNFGFYNAPKEMPVRITALYEGEEIGSLELQDFCSLKDESLVIELPEDIKTSDINSKIRLNCVSCESSNLSSTVSNPTSYPVYSKEPIGMDRVYIYFYNPGCRGGWSAGCMWNYAGKPGNNGRISLNGLRVGKKYKVIVYGYYGFYPYWFRKEQTVTLQETGNDMNFEINY